MSAGRKLTFRCEPGRLGIILILKVGRQATLIESCYGIGALGTKAIAMIDNCRERYRSCRGYFKQLAGDEAAGRDREALGSGRERSRRLRSR